MLCLNHRSQIHFRNKRGPDISREKEPEREKRVDNKYLHVGKQSPGERQRGQGITSRKVTSIADRKKAVISGVGGL